MAFASPDMFDDELLDACAHESIAMFLLDRVQHGVPQDVVRACGRMLDAEADGATVLAIAMNREWLTPTTAAIVVCVYLEGLTGHEAARRYQGSEETARYRCSSGVRQLRHMPSY